MSEGERRSLESCIGIASEEGWIEDDERERLEGELRGLREAAAALDAARAREAALVAALRELVAGIGATAPIRCDFCHAYDEEEETHEPDCPYVRAAALVAAPGGDGAEGGA